jgi:hypothetical protein
VLKIIISILLIVAVSGCATRPFANLKRERFDQLPAKYAQFDFKLAWDSKVSADRVDIQGMIWNVRWAHAEGVEVWVSLLDPEGRVLAKNVALIMPHSLDIDEMAPFSIDLKVPASPLPGSKLLFTYRYNGVEDSEGSVSWMQSFKVKL